MGDILFDWMVSKLAGTNEWKALRDNDETIRAGSLEELREKVIEHVTSADPNAHILALLDAIDRLADHGLLDHIDCAEDGGAFLTKAVERARVYLKRDADSL